MILYIEGLLYTNSNYELCIIKIFERKRKKDKQLELYFNIFTNLCNIKKVKLLIFIFVKICSVLILI
jgi:hypothetical protein